MQTYVIRRRNFWKSVAELEATAKRSAHVGNVEMPHLVRWIRSYVVEEPGGKLGTVCIYQALNEDAIRAHAHRVGMPADEIAMVAKTVVVRDDPVEELQAA